MIKKTRCLGSQGCKIIILMVIILTQIILVSSMEFDNVKEYDELTKTVTITNAFGLGGTIAEATLKTPTSIIINVDTCEGGKGIDCLVGEIEINSYEDYADVFNEMESFNIKDGMKTIQKEYTFKQKVKTGERTINDYDSVCDKTYQNGSVMCENKLVGTHQEDVYEYQTINEKEGLKIGLITIGIFTDVQEGEHTEVIPTLFGERVSEWFDFTGASVYASWEHKQYDTNSVLGAVQRGLIWWTNVSNFTLRGVELDVGGGAASNCNLTIWKHGADNKPSEAMDSNATFSPLLTGGSGNTGWFNITMPNLVQIQNNTNYSSVLSCDGTVYIGTSSTGAVEQRMIRTPDGGSTWLWTDEPVVTRIWGNASVGGEGVYNIGVSLDSPSNNLHTALTSLEFNSTLTPTNLNMTNATIYIWYTNHSVYSSNTQSILSNETTKVNWTFSGIPYDNFKWNVYACGNNSICSYHATSNYTFLVNSFTENSQTFNATTVETTTENFMINITYNTSKFTIGVGILNYNGTDYLGTSSISGPDRIFSRSVVVPTFISQQNVSFKWRFTLTGVDGTFYDNSTIQNQTVNIINGSIYEFPYTVPYINFTVFNETSLTRINVTFKSTFNYGLSSTTKTLSYEDLTGKNSSFSFAFTPPDKNYLVSGDIEYSAPGFITRTYNLPEQFLSNVTTQVNLYLLSSGLSTSFIVYVRDSSYTAVSGATVYIQKYDTGTATWINTETVETNAEGKAIGHFVSEDITYRFLVYVGGVLQLTSSSTKIFCEVSPCTITLTLPSSSGAVTFGNITGLDESLTYSKTTNLLTFTYIDSDINAEGGRLEVNKINLGNSTNVLICNVTSVAVSDILNCDISSGTNSTYVARGYITRSGSEIFVDMKIINKISDIISTIGLDGIVWSVFILIAIVMLGLQSPVLAIIFGVAGIVMVSLLGLAFIPTTSVIIIIFIALIFFWEMKGR